MKTIIALMLACLLASASTHEYTINTVTLLHGGILVGVVPDGVMFQTPMLCVGPDATKDEIPCHESIERPVPAELR